MNKKLLVLALLIVQGCGDDSPAKPQEPPAPKKETGFTLETDPPGATVSLDDIELGQKTPLTLTGVKPGTHRIRISKGEKYRALHIQIDVVEGEITQIPFKILELAPVVITFRGLYDNYPKNRSNLTDPPRKNQSVKMGTLSVQTRPWSKVYVDGELISNTPLVNHELKPGKYTVTVKNPTYDVERKYEVEIKPGKTTTLVKTLI